MVCYGWSSRMGLPGFLLKGKSLCPWWSFYCCPGTSKWKGPVGSALVERGWRSAHHLITFCVESCEAIMNTWGHYESGLPLILCAVQDSSVPPRHWRWTDKVVVCPHPCLFIFPCVEGHRLFMAEGVSCSDVFWFLFIHFYNFSSCFSHCIELRSLVLI